MPIIISGYLVTDTRKLRDHAGHPLRSYVSTDTDRVSLSCQRCATLIEAEPAPRNDLPCGCSTQAEHDDGLAIQAKYRKQFRMTRSACPGCALGDDGPSIHDCYIHRA